MNRTVPLLTGIVACFAVAWFGIVAYSHSELGTLGTVIDEASGDINPPPVSGLATAGQAVYVANGCVACHTQEVRPGYLSSDVARGLGIRRTVARDYLRSQPALPGTLRIGPDLANFGLRAKDAAGVHRLLFEPSQVHPGSNMPSFRFLYITRPISGQRSNLALANLTGPHAPLAGYEVVPSEDATTLVAYLLSLKRDYPLPEAPPEPAQ